MTRFQTQTGNVDAGARQDAVYSQSSQPKSADKSKYKPCNSEGRYCGGVSTEVILAKARQGIREGKGQDGDRLMSVATPAQILLEQLKASKVNGFPFFAYTGAMHVSQTDNMVTMQMPSKPTENSDCDGYVRQGH